MYDNNYKQLANIAHHSAQEFHKIRNQLVRHLSLKTARHKPFINYM